ncbi:MAG: hypothetical protein C0417_08700 [Chlorobiaceae bacterium]|nr:hypothetical protein [Chlorobiaceae bacterium]
MAGNSEFDLSVIIVNWNTQEDLDNCLASCLSISDDLTKELIVVDNGSADQSVLLVKQKYPEVKLIENRYNIGFAAAVNQGLSLSKGTYLLVLNPDITIPRYTVSKLIDIFEIHPDAGAIAPRLINKDGSYQVGYFRKYPSMMQILLFYTSFSKFTSRNDKLFRKYMEDIPTAESDLISVPQIPGGCMMIRREILDDVGFMDEKFFLFFEDVDWCYRIKKKGWTLLMVNSVFMNHLGGRSILKQKNEWIYGRFLLSLNQFVDKHYKIRYQIVTKIITVGNSVFVLIVKSILRYSGLFRNRSKLQESISSNRLFLKMFFEYYMKIIPPMK